MGNAYLRLVTPATVNQTSQPEGRAAVACHIDGLQLKFCDASYRPMVLTFATRTAAVDSSPKLKDRDQSGGCRR